MAKAPKLMLRSDYTVPGLDVDLDEVRRTFEVNVFAVMAMCQAFAPLLIEAQGTIVQIGSVSATMPHVFGSAYNASKAALHQYSNTLRVELEPFGVNVVTVVTGAVTSRIARTHRTLPEGSLYIPVADQYERRLTQSQEKGNSMPNEEYARRVVNKVLGSRRKAFSIWEGARSYWFDKNSLADFGKPQPPAVNTICNEPSLLACKLSTNGSRPTLIDSLLFSRAIQIRLSGGLVLYQSPLPVRAPPFPTSASPSSYGSMRSSEDASPVKTAQPEQDHHVSRFKRFLNKRRRKWEAWIKQTYVDGEAPVTPGGGGRTTFGDEDPNLITWKLRIRVSSDD
ncbi:MAG: hypothetical protein Q9162_005708 [Coniocarpon cinnabarinum]